MSTSPHQEGEPEARPSTLLNRLLPFSPSLLRSLPKATRPARYTRADGIPQTESDDEGLQPTVQDYHAINDQGAANVRVPKKIATPVRVEGKVWFANERTWVSWLNLSVLIGTIALALFNASTDNPVARIFAYTYAVISVGVLVYGYLLYQHRITMIRRRDPGHFDNPIGPLVVSALLFIAVLTNFIIRVIELKRKNVPIPGSDFVQSFFSKPAFPLRGTNATDTQRAFGWA